MAIPVSLRGDFDAARLRGLAKQTKDGPQARRLLALAAIYDGATRTEAAKIDDVGLQIIRDWVLRFNARGPDGLLNVKPPGQPSKLNAAQRQAIARMIESGPIPAIHGVVRWRLIDLAQWIYEEFRIAIAKQTLWHMSTCLVIPSNITIIALPPKCPELNPIENIWQFVRDNRLSNRVFKSYDDLVDHCCEAWNKLVDQPWRIMSIGLRQWAHGF
jgi:transposase